MCVRRGLLHDDVGLGDVGHGLEAQVARTRRVVFDEVQAKVFAVDKVGILDPRAAVRGRTRAAVAVHLLLQRAAARFCPARFALASGASPSLSAG